MFRKKKTSSIESFPNNAIKIAFISGSGYGDTLIFANYLQTLKKKFDMYELSVDVYLSAGFNSHRSIFSGTSLCSAVLKTP